VLDALLEERHGEEIGLGQADDPSDGRQQRNACDQRQREAHGAGLWALGFGQAAAEDGDEDDVVHTQDDFEGGEGDQGDGVVPGQERLHVKGQSQHGRRV
jgi:hypothetical protein